MDTKSTKNSNTARLHPVRAWFCFALAMTLLLGLAAVGIGLSGEIYDAWPAIIRAIPHAARFDCHGTDEYWSVLLDYLDYLDYALSNGIDPILRTTETDAIEDAGNTTVPDETTHLDIPITDVSGSTESRQIFYYSPLIDHYFMADVDAQNLTFTASLNGKTAATESLDLYTCGGLALTGGELYVIEPNASSSGAGRLTQIPGTDLWGRPCEDLPSLREYLREINFDFSLLNPDFTAILLPNDLLLRNGGLLGHCRETTLAMGMLFWCLTLLIVFILVLFVIAAIHHRGRAKADRAIGGFLGHVWIELRLAVLLLAGGVYLLFVHESDEMLAYTLLIATGWFWLYLIGVDLRVNGLRTFTCNIFATVVSALRRRRARLPLHRALARRAWLWLIPAVLCIGSALLILLLTVASGSDAGYWLAIPACLYLAGGTLLFLALNYRTRQDDAADVAALAQRIIDIHSGKNGAPIVLSPDSVLSPCAAALEDLQAGIETAVAERTRSERTKIEMVTNISHDLKTPLTSIVGYANLLADVENLPPEAADYVAVITRKSARLNALIKDLFALSKATTNDLPLEPEPMDLARLLNQLLAEQTDAIAASPITLVTTLPEHECPLCSDGAKLYRVFANLLENALRYALDGSRVFLTLSDAVAADGCPVWRVSVKNTSREYLDFSADEILARFVRGDKNRSTDGNGLGLPIAKSFTELCGGRFNLILDGDLFTVVIDLPKEGIPQQK